MDGRTLWLPVSAMQIRNNYTDTSSNHWKMKLTCGKLGVQRHKSSKSENFVVLSVHTEQPSNTQLDSMFSSFTLSAKDDFTVLVQRYPQHE